MSENIIQIGAGMSTYIIYRLIHKGLSARIPNRFVLSLITFLLTLAIVCGSVIVIKSITTDS